MCEKFVKDRLKAPSTADFAPMRDQSASKQEGGSWRVAGYVDAQNGFGAQIRSIYACELIPTGGDNWRLLDIAIN